MSGRPRSRAPELFLPVLAALCAAAGCSRDTSQLRPAPLSTDPVVFLDAFPPGMDFQAFLGSRLDALSIDTVEKYRGTAALKITVPAPGATGGGYAGGAFIAPVARDLSGYDALTFWARSNVPSRFDVVGLGNDNSGTSKYEARWGTVLLSTTWTRYVVPIPAPDRLAAERGLFFFAEGPEGLSEHAVWFDEVQFERVGTITNPRPVMTTRTISASVGASVAAEGTQTTFSVGGVDQRIDHMPGYFDYVSSNEAVARGGAGTIEVVGGGTALVTARLGTVDVTGTLTVTATAPPATAAPTPTLPQADVISLFSDAYSNVVVDTWSAEWDAADVSDVLLAGNATKFYRNLSFAGIEFTSAPIDATPMTHVHLDVFAPTGTVFRIKLVDFGADGVFGGGDDREHELPFGATSTPAFTPGGWVALDVPLAAFAGLQTRGHLAQLILSGDTPAVYVDNVYLHR